MKGTCLNNSEIYNTSNKELVSRLITGNKRFVEGKPKEKDYVGDLKKWSSGQKPYAAILSCSDSRVPLEIIFDETIGNLFVVRVAGSIIDNITLGSIEFAVSQLGVELFVILGHTDCGAIKASLSSEKVDGYLNDVAKCILPAYHNKCYHLNDKKEEYLAAKDNVKYQISSCLEKSEIIKKSFDEKKLTILSGIYNVDTGIVDFF